MAGTRARLRNAGAETAIWFGLREDPRLSDGERRASELFWLIVGPVLLVSFIWTTFGRDAALVSIVIFVPIVGLGIRSHVADRRTVRFSAPRHD